MKLNLQPKLEPRVQVIEILASPSRIRLCRLEDDVARENARELTRLDQPTTNKQKMKECHRKNIFKKQNYQPPIDTKDRHTC